MHRVVMIYNASAGSADVETRAAALNALRKRADVAEAVVETPDDTVRYLSEYPDRLPVAAGGDGTLHSVVAALVARGEAGTRPVGLIPLGTGNDFAHTVGIPHDPAAAAEALADGRERWMDLLVDDVGGIAINAVHLGVGARASYSATPLKPVLGRFAYPVGGLAAGLRSAGWRLRVEVDGRVVEAGGIAAGRGIASGYGKTAGGDGSRVLMVGIGNGNRIGGGTPLAPGAHPDDGLADVIVSFATTPVQRLVYAMRLRRGRHTGLERVTAVRGRRISVAGEPVPVNSDGELSDPVTRRTWTVRHRAWRIIVPKRDSR